MQNLTIAFLELSSAHHNLLLAAQKVSRLTREIMDGKDVPFETLTSALVSLDMMTKYAEACQQGREPVRTDA